MDEVKLIPEGEPGAEEQREQIATCVACGEAMADITALASIVAERKIETANAIEKLLVCPHCGHQLHVCYLNQRLIGLQAIMSEMAARWQKSRDKRWLVEYRTARRTYERQFETYNRQMRRTYGGESPVSLIAAGGGHGEKTDSR